LSPGTVLCCAVGALASAVDAVPKIEASSEAVVHLEKTPAALGTVGTPNVVAAVSRSLFQHDRIGLRLVFEVSWTLRASGAIAWLSGAAW